MASSAQIQQLGQLEKFNWQLRTLRSELESARMEADALRSELQERARFERVLLAPDLQRDALGAVGAGARRPRTGRNQQRIARGGVSGVWAA